MDLDSIAEKVSNLTVYDLKAGFRKAQNGNQSSIMLSNLAQELTQ